MNLQLLSLPSTPRLVTVLVLSSLPDQDGTLFSKSYFDKDAGLLRSFAAFDFRRLPSWSLDWQKQNQLLPRISVGTDSRANATP